MKIQLKHIAETQKFVREPKRGGGSLQEQNKETYGK